MNRRWEQSLKPKIQALFNVIILILYIFLYESSQRSKAVALNVKLLDLYHEFLSGSQLPNAIDKKVLPEHIRHCFSIDGNRIQIGGLHADSPNELVRVIILFCLRSYHLLVCCLSLKVHINPSCPCGVTCYWLFMQARWQGSLSFACSVSVFFFFPLVGAGSCV